MSGFTNYLFKELHSIMVYRSLLAIAKNRLLELIFELYQIL